MTAPAATLAASSTTPGNDFPGSDPQRLKYAAGVILANSGCTWGPNRINRLVTRFVERVEGSGVEFFDFLTNAVALTAEERRAARANPDVARAISHADPTGETAVNNVMREARS